MNLFSLASFILGLLSGSQFPKQEVDEIKGEDGSRWSHVCQVEMLCDDPEDDVSDDQLS